jgi:hypothetical protein
MNTRSTRIFAGILTFSILVTGCTRESSTAFTDFPVIEAYLEPGNSIVVQVSRQVPFLDNVTYSADDINNLAITITHNDTSYLLEPLDSGRYTNTQLNLSEGDEFNLSFTFDSRNISAYTYIPAKPANLAQSATKIYVPRMDSLSGPPSGTMSNPVEITWDNEDASYYLMVVENIEETPDPISDFGDEEPPGNRFRKSPTNSNSEMLRTFDFQYFGKHRIILYHVLPDYATLYEQNSSSSLNLTNPSSSITNGYGIFTGLNSDTLYILVKESSK